MGKIINKREAAQKIKDGSTVGVTGFVLALHAETVTSEIEACFLETGRPQGLTVMCSNGVGDSRTRGTNHFAHEGLLARMVAGHYGLAPMLGPLIINNKFEAYCLPQGSIAQMYRARAGGRPGILSRVGLGTFVDPRLEGGKMNTLTKKDIVKVMEIDGEEFLYYKSIDVDVAIIRATTADEKGNLSMEKEPFYGETLALAQAAKASGGIVIAEVERIVRNGSIDPRMVRLPHVLVDYIVVGDDDKLTMTANIKYNPAISGEIRIPLQSIPILPLNDRKVMARRAAMELRPDMIINLGIGVPDGVSSVMAEEGISDCITMTIEAGVYGGTAVGGADFGGSYNAEAFVEMPSQFDYYDGGSLDLTCLGMAELDGKGNVNVSKFGTRVVGPGGFINISQNAKNTVYCGALTAGGLKTEIGNGSLKIVQEGKAKKFMKEVQQVTFSGDYARKVGQNVLYITERAVFRLTPAGVELTEIAPGVDLQKEVLGQIEGKVLVSENLKLMDPRIFTDAPMNIKSEITGNAGSRGS
ncbi:MAG: acyl CoA:acetate/3-ketoacid CoA transferase [Deltaproteobacteria bacterium]|jgi:propionate CoA-transferase|nr:acyl CoA:acetate/3-ketoacid CoA transferase [Deltaproteobacteria bacterium]